MCSSPRSTATSPTCADRSNSPTHHSPTHHSAFTLIEVLLATALTLVIMAATVTLFGSVTTGIAGSRAIIETMDRLRGTSERLILDLRGVTAPMLPPLKPDEGLGYFEVREGPSFNTALNPAAQDPFGNADTTIMDLDDVLMFTSRSTTEPFIGGYTYKRAPIGGEPADGNDGSDFVLQNVTFTSQVAEIAWFVRGTTLYRRVLLVAPSQGIQDNDTRNAAFSGFCQYDLSVRQVGGPQDPDQYGTPQPAAWLMANSLADLTKRENRFGHNPKHAAGALYGFPHSIGRWGQLGLPTLRECNHPNWPLPFFNATATYPIPVVGVPAAGFPSAPNVDYWGNPHPWGGVDSTSGALSTYAFSGSAYPFRVAEDVILTNVIGFDVKVWDPGAPVREVTATGTVTVPGDADYGTQTIIGFGAYVDMGWSPGYTEAATSPASLFHDDGTLASLPQVYDTWSTHYESDGVNQDGDGTTDEGTDGADNDTNDGVDDPGEREAPAPYPFPLRGVQVKIRVFEPDSRQIREVTVVQDFLPE